MDSHQSASGPAMTSEDTSDIMKCPICEEKTAKTCSACKSVAYCCVEHQRLDWKNHKKVCQPQAFSIQKTENMGMGWFATRDLPAGFLLLEEVPALQSPGFSWKWGAFFTDSSRKCVTCAAEMKTMRSCSTCFWPVCSNKCEKNSLHKDNECKEFVSRKLKYPPPAHWPVGMLTMCMRANVMKAHDPRKFEQLMAFQDFYDIPSENQKLQEIDLPAGMFEVLSGPNCLERDEFRKLLRISLASAFSGSSSSSSVEGSNERILIRVFLKASRLNHSCSGNCVVYVDPNTSTKMRVSTCVAVKKGEQLFLDYFLEPPILPRAHRQKTLHVLGFMCKCKRCLDPTEMGTFLMGIKCFNCSSMLRADSDPDGDQVGFLVPINPLDDQSPDAEYECHRCHFKCPHSKVLVTPPSVIGAFKMLQQQLDADLVDLKSVDSLLTKLEEDPTVKMHIHPNHCVIQRPTRQLTGLQMESLDKMTEEELDRVVRRLEYLYNITEKLYPGWNIGPKYEDMKRLFMGAAFLYNRFATGMAPEKLAKLREIHLKIEEYRLAFRRMTGQTKTFTISR